MKKFLNYFIAAVFAVVGFSSCLDNNEEEWQKYLDEQEALRKKIIEQFVADSTLIADYLVENDSVATYHEDYNIFYNIIEEGFEPKPDANSLVKVHYKGTLLDGTVFDSTGIDPVQIDLSNVIRGWRLGVPLIGEGGKIVLYLPSYFGYGEYEKENIPANSVLIFEVGLEGVWMF